MHAPPSENLINSNGVIVRREKDRPLKFKCRPETCTPEFSYFIKVYDAEGISSKSYKMQGQSLLCRLLHLHR